MGVKSMSDVTTDIFSKLSHDLKNDFVIIRAALGSIKKQLSQSSMIDQKIAVITNVLNTATQRLEMVYVLSKEFNNDKF